MPAWNLGYAAAAIIAALSVDNARLGKYTSIPAALAHSSNVARNWLFAATPPETSTLPADNCLAAAIVQDRKSTRLNSSHSQISYAVFCLKKKNDNSTFTSYDTAQWSKTRTEQREQSQRTAIGHTSTPLSQQMRELTGIAQLAITVIRRT